MLIKTDPDTIKSYFEDSSNLKGGYAERLVMPETVEELSGFLEDANSSRTPVTVSGGGTSTTGARIPFGGIIVSLEKMNRLVSISKKKSLAVVQAGLSVEDFRSTCEKEGLFYTSHPTERSAFLGGTLSTNASGSRSFKYGPMRAWVRRLKMVLADGHILDIKRGDRFLARDESILELNDGTKIAIPIPTYHMPATKNSAGYFAKEGMDLLDLFVGQEGTLSVVVEAEVALAEMPERILSLFVFFKTGTDAWLFSDELKHLSKAKGSKSSHSLDMLSIEYFDSNALKFLEDKTSNIPSGTVSAVFFEVETSAGKEDRAIEELASIISKHNTSLDNTWVAMNEKEADGFTKLRYAIPETVNEIIRRSEFSKVSTDLAVPDEKASDMMAFYTELFAANDIEHVIFGHIGENNLHVNILPHSKDELKLARDLVLQFVRKAVEFGGSVSAEHGIGKIKHAYLEEMYGKRGIMEMARIKKALDPNCILGLDNIFARTFLESL